MFNRGAVCGIILVSFLVILTSWYAAKMSVIVPFSGATLTSVGTLTQGTVVQMNPAGQVEYKGTVAQASENGGQDVNLLGLQLVDYSQTIPWTLTAATGMLSDHNNTLDLGGGVALSRPAASNNPAILVQTQQAHIDLESQIITGEGPITVTQPGTLNTIQGVGFKAKITSRQLEFLKEVQSVYLPPSR
jgi:LPS export ABC transporter protein LptC